MISGPTSKAAKPSEYISKSATFYERKFYVDERTHIPRKNTEPLVKKVIEFINKQDESYIVADVGTGAGVIAIILALECKNVSKIFATDYTEDILEVAKINVDNYKLESKIILRQGSLLEPIKEEKIDVIVANLPHASEEKLETLRPQVKEYEPLKGYFGGKTGLELYEQLFSQLQAHKMMKFLKGIFIKISPQHKEQVKFLHQQYLSEFNLEIGKDEEGKIRIASFVRI